MPGSWVIVAAMGLSQPAGAAMAEIKSFDCCHVTDPGAKAPTTRRIMVVPPADRRAIVQDAPDRFDTVVGVARGGYGNPFNLQSPASVQELVGEALQAQLQALGHKADSFLGAAPGPGEKPLAVAELVQIGKEAQADLVVHGNLRDWEVDVGAYGSFRTLSDLDLVVVDVATGRIAWESELGEEVEGRRIKTARTNAKDWYGKKSARYIWTAAVEQALVELVSPLSQPGSYFLSDS